jgi:NADPH:quinone reductase-like Zn-dependent oxidoreductase
MRAAGIRRFGGHIETLDLPQPREPKAGEVLLRVRTAGCGVWEEYVRTGDWDIGARPPMALGVEAAGVVERVGAGVAGVSLGDEVLTYPLQLLDQGAWAELLLAPAALVVPKPPELGWSEAGALPVPGITALQVVQRALSVQPGERVLVNGAGGVTGGCLVQTAVLADAEVIATAGPSSVERLRSYGAREVIDYHDTDWPRRVQEAFGAVDAAANATSRGAAATLQAVADGGRLVTITGDPPESERGVTVTDFVLAPDPGDLARAAGLAGEGRLRIPVAAEFPLERAAEVLALAVASLGGGAVVLTVQQS